MVHDRPAMARAANRKSPVWKWCVRHFAGSSFGQHIYWDSKPPTAKSEDAEHQMPLAGENAYVNIRATHTNTDGTQRVATGEEQWSHAVYELNNIENDAEFQRIDNAVASSRLTRRAYIEQSTRLEYLACLKTALVYKHLWHKSRDETPEDTANWFYGVPNTYEAWIALYTDHSQYPWDSWGKYYDDLAAYYGVKVDSDDASPLGATAITWPPPEPFKVSDDDLRYGEKQVERMVHDRPAMAQYIDNQSPIWQWCARQYAGVAAGKRVGWNKGTPPQFDNGGVNEWPANGKPGYIQIDTMQRKDGRIGAAMVAGSCAALWAQAVYHLIAMATESEVTRIYNDAVAGKLSKAQYIEQNTRLDYQSDRMTAIVYEHLWKQTQPATVNAGHLWFTDMADRYETWIALYTDHSGYPWDSYGTYFDNEIIPYLTKIGKLPK